MASVHLLFAGTRDGLLALAPGRVLDLGGTRATLGPLTVRAEVDLGGGAGAEGGAGAGAGTGAGAGAGAGAGTPALRARLVIQVPALAPYRTLILAGRCGVADSWGSFERMAVRAETLVIEVDLGPLGRILGASVATGEWALGVILSEITLTPGRFPARPAPGCRIDLHPDFAVWQLHIEKARLESQLETQRQANHAVSLALSVRPAPPPLYASTPPPPLYAPAPPPLYASTPPSLHAHTPLYAPMPLYTPLWFESGAAAPQPADGQRTPREQEQVEAAIKVIRGVIGRREPNMLRDLSLRLTDLITETLAAITESESCVLCTAQPACARLFPCTHQVLCEVCAEQVLRTYGKCPVCRAAIEGIAALPAKV